MYAEASPSLTEGANTGYTLYGRSLAERCIKWVPKPYARTNLRCTVQTKEGGGSTSPAQGLVSTQIQINVLTLHPMSLLCSHLGNRNSQNKQLIKHVGLFSIVKGRERNYPGDTWHCEGT